MKNEVTAQADDGFDIPEALLVQNRKPVAAEQQKKVAAAAKAKPQAKPKPAPKAAAKKAKPVTRCVRTGYGKAQPVPSWWTSFVASKARPTPSCAR